MKSAEELAAIEAEQCRLIRAYVDWYRAWALEQARRQALAEQRRAQRESMRLLRARRGRTAA